MSRTVALRDSNRIVKTKRFITLENFQLRYAGKEDGYKYEWNNGLIEKTLRTMRKEQYGIAKRLMRLFATTTAYKNGSELMVEGEMFLPTANRTRIGDLVYMTEKQIDEAEQGINYVSDFVIEIISKTDEVIEVDTKMEEYFANGVKVAWYIFPTLKKVEVFTSPNLVTICRENDICQALPALPDFNIAVKDIFKKPLKSK